MEEHKENNTNNEISRSLNVLCAICSEFFRNTDFIYSTSKCGHVFHRHCIFRWLTRSSTCPQCRTSVHNDDVHRLFLNYNEPSTLVESELKSLPTFEWIYVNENASTEDLEHSCYILGTEEGDPVFAARVYLKDDLLPCYYVPKLKGVYAAWNCESHFLTEGIELLHINNDNAEYKWVLASNGEVPPYALETGYSELGETLYIARAMYNDNVRFGKLHRSHACAYMPYDGKEVNNKNYEVLVRIATDKE